MPIKRFENIVQHAASGLQMPERLARKIEELSRGLPRDFHYRRVAHKTDSLSLDAGERTDVSVINTDAVDREGECVLPAGGDWSTYNRVVTFAHRYDQLPVGSNWWIRPVRQAQGGVKGPALVAKTHYPQKPADWGDAPWLPSAVLHLMQQPVPTCTGKSIGFLPLNVRPATPDEIAKRPELRGVPIIDRWVGIEYAVVPVPCNPEAEMQAVAKGMELGLIDRKVMDLIEESGRQFGGFASGDVEKLHGFSRITDLDEASHLRDREGEPYGRRSINRDELRLRILGQIRETFAELHGRVG